YLGVRSGSFEPYEHMGMDAALPASKRALLEKRLRTLGRTLLAYSGGVDSAFLAWAAHQVLGDNMLAVITDSPSLARTQLADAIAFACEYEIPVKVIATNELDRPEYLRNDAARCFFCKDELFTMMEDFRRDRKSTRLNSSHGSISYAVFCLKKKNKYVLIKPL